MIIIFCERISLSSSFFKLRMPGSELHELFLCSVIVSLILIELCNLCHLIICKSEVQDIEIVLYVIDILASRDNYKAHLGVPAEDYLGRTFACPMILPM